MHKYHRVKVKANLPRLYEQMTMACSKIHKNLIRYAKSMKLPSKCS